MDAYHQYSARRPDYDIGDDFSDIDPGERIGAPLRRRRPMLLRGLLLICAVGGGGIAVEKTIRPGWLGEASTFALAAGERALALIEASSQKPAIGKPAAGASPPEPATAAPQADVRAADASVPAPVVAAKEEPRAGLPTADPPKPEPQQIVAAAVPPKSSDYETPVTEAPRAAEDPLRARAEAAGLHPELSRAVLAKLSKADLRNAETAIRTALAETPDDKTFTWPRQRKPELALFEIHFVAGAAPSCRRYVVTIAKDGWLTTALPMEKCGGAVAGKPS